MDTITFLSIILGLLFSVCLEFVPWFRALTKEGKRFIALVVSLAGAVALNTAVCRFGVNVPLIVVDCSGDFNSLFQTAVLVSSSSFMSNELVVKNAPFLISLIKILVGSEVKSDDQS